MRIATMVVIAACALRCAAQESDPPGPLGARELIGLSRKIEKRVEEIRGWKFKQPVSTEVYTEPQLRKFIEKKVFEEEYAGDRLEHAQQMLRMVGLIPADCDLRKTIMDILLSQIGGFYDPETKSFYMLQRTGVDYGPMVNGIMIAHELTHALDDQYLDLDKLMKSREKTEDSSFAIGAVVEGSATLLMMQYTAALVSEPGVDFGDFQRVAESEMRRSEPFMKAPRYFTTLVATYLLGMSFVANGEAGAMQEEEQTPRLRENLKRLAETPPKSSEQILHPEKYWDASKRDEPAKIDDAKMRQILEADGWRVAHSDALGEILCAILTSPGDQTLDMAGALTPGYWTNDAATGWGADRFYLLKQADAAGTKKGPTDAPKPPAQYRAVWLTVWDTPQDRDEFVQDYSEQRPSKDRGQAKIVDRGAVYFFNVPASEQESIAAAIQKAAPARLKR